MPANSFLRTSIGAKQAMAISGLALIGFAFVHMLGNLQIFAGPDLINAYGAKLRGIPGLLWVARVGLLVMVILHIISAFRVTLQNRAARPDGYAKKKNITTGLAARSMMISGIFFTAYVVYHLLHFTAHVVNNEYSNGLDAKGHHDVYTMIVGSFQNPMIAGAYIVAMILLALHLSHGIGSFMQTLGVNHPRYSTMRFAGPVLAIVLLLGYISVPLAVLMGILDIPAGGH